MVLVLCTPRPQWDFSYRQQFWFFLSIRIWERSLSSQIEEPQEKKKWCTSVVARVTVMSRGEMVSSASRESRNFCCTSSAGWHLGRGDIEVPYPALDEGYSRGGRPHSHCPV